jgi:hypothetical protein
MLAVAAAQVRLVPILPEPTQVVMEARVLRLQFLGLP